MSTPLSSEIPKPFGSTEKVAAQAGQKLTPSLPIPAFSDIGKKANDVRQSNVKTVVRDADNGYSSSERTSTTPRRVTS